MKLGTYSFNKKKKRKNHQVLKRICKVRKVTVAGPTLSFKLGGQKLKSAGFIFYHENYLAFTKHGEFYSLKLSRHMPFSLWGKEAPKDSSVAQLLWAK